jgi:hypothetical protein
LLRQTAKRGGEAECSFMVSIHMAFTFDFFLADAMGLICLNLPSAS